VRPGAFVVLACAFTAACGSDESGTGVVADGNAGAGGSSAGSAGTGPGSGGAAPSTGGATPSAGGTAPNTGGAAPGGGGASSGGSVGTGGAYDGSDLQSVVVNQLKVQPGLCLPTALPISSSYGCVILEASTDADAAACSAPGRLPAPAALAARAMTRLQAINGCGDPQIPTPACALFHVCEIQVADASCLTPAPDASAIGWCYVAPDDGFGDPTLVADCPSGLRWKVRFVGANTPAPGADVFLACGTRG